MLDAFQSAAKAVSVNEVGVLVPLYDFYPSIESFLDTAVKKTIDQAETNPSLDSRSTSTSSRSSSSSATWTRSRATWTTS